MTDMTSLSDSLDVESDYSHPKDFLDRCRSTKFGMLLSCLISTSAGLMLYLQPEEADAHPTWRTVLLTDAAAQRGAVCLDGSPAGYYIESGYGDGADKWIVHLQGGGWCVSIDDCFERAQTNLGSSKDFKSREAKNEFLGWYDGGAQGLLSNSCSINPDFCNWNKVYVRYCDGASYSGNVPNPIPVGSGSYIYFRGRYILDAVLDSLLIDEGMAKGTKLIAKGCSAGGLGIWLHLDYIRQRVPKRIDIVGVPECGFFMDLPTFRGEPDWTQKYRHIASMQNVLAENGNLNKDCLHAYPKEPWRCFMAQYNIPYVKTPYFIINSVYDEWYLANIIALPEQCYKQGQCTDEQDEASASLRSSIVGNITKNTRVERSGFFLYNCVTHCWQVNRDDRWNVLSDGKMTLREAFSKWYFDHKRIRSLGAASLGPNSEKTCFNK
eukprot:TRINITY_DN74714_c0_g1_i1.p1 TRINITY_DN74714_c0_g1~~TRINITY_DN74714_c0_g1_i1.p1  ORF type:complete len:469 (-),score=49.11 TRINITY_DN74714_c0_g1_i1:166-1476(-)